MQDVNRLLKQFDEMSAMMKRMNKLGQKGLMRHGLSALMPAQPPAVLNPHASRLTETAQPETDGPENSPCPRRRQEAAVLPHRRRRQPVPRDGRFIEKLGSYNPMLPPEHDERVRLFRTSASATG